MPRKTTLGRKAVYAVIIVTGIYLVVCVGLTLAQRRLLYFPCKDSAASSGKLAASLDFQVWHNAGGQFIGWKRLSKTTPAQGQVLILHGNAGCALDRAPYADGLQSAAPLDVYVLEYPGYDGRPGSPTQKTIFAAARDGLEQLKGQCHLFLIGESLGTGVAAYLAGTYPAQVSGVFLSAPYNNLSAVARHHLPIFPVKLMLRDKYASDLFLRSYHGPLGVLLAGNDEVVPNKFGRRLYQGYDGPKKLWEFPQARHNDLLQPKAEFWTEVLEFFNQRPKPRP